ncbi:MAG TPA: hypothetical protein VEH01_03795 [Nitrososphaerales archaeon]|nr:hypothetical protein [Nitrososphaerales archaeon]
MSRRGNSEDISTLLYLVPFVGGVVYSVALWVQSGLSATLPNTVYLAVTRDPIFFIIASLSVMLGVIVEMNGTEQSARQAKLSSLGNTLQAMAVASLVIVILAAWYANGFTDLGGTATDFIVGKYGLVFPALLVLLSYLITAQFRLEALANRNGIAVIALLLVPASLYEIGKHETALGVGIAFVLLVVGAVFYLMPEKKTKPEEK